MQRRIRSFVTVGLMLAAYLAVLGFQLIFASFFICLLDQVPEPAARKSAARPIASATAEP